MSPVNRKRLVGTIVCSLIALVIWVWPTPYAYLHCHQSSRIQTLSENRLTGRISIFNQRTRRWDYDQEPKQELASSEANHVAPRPVLAVVPEHHVERAFLNTPQLYKACLLADAIVHSVKGGTRQFTREEFQLAKRCVAYITGALDTLPGKAEIIGVQRYEFAFRDHKVLVGNAVDSFNRYVQAHPESANWSGAETLAIALVNDNIAGWLQSAAQPTTMPTKTHEQGIPSKPMR